MQPPIFIDVFMQPLRDNSLAQVAFAAFCFLMLLDILLGYAAAVKGKTVKSAKMREGLWRKLGGVLACLRRGIGAGTWHCGSMTFPVERA